MALYCFKCKNNFPSITSLVLHLKIQHRCDNNGTYRCSQSNCVRDFSTLKSFKHHLKYKHILDQTHNLINKNYTKSNVMTKLHPQKIIDTPLISVEAVEAWNMPLTSSIVETFNDMLNRECMSFLSKLYHSSLVPRKYIQDIVDFVSEFLNGGFIDILKQFVLDIFIKHRVEEKYISDVDCLFNNLINSFNEYKTEYLRTKKFENDKLYVKPVEFIIGERKKQSIDLDGETVMLKCEKVRGQFIPLTLVFTELFKIDGMYSDMLVHINKLKNEDLMCNVYQSPHFRSIIQNFDVTSSKLVLPLLMYYDEFECGNPLGSHSGKQKLGAVYVSLPTIPPQYSSLQENIFLALLFHSNDRKEFGNNAVFRILVDEFKALEKSGINFVLKQYGFIEIRFVLTLILGDNLGLHSVLGFSESFNCQFNCRFCRIDKQASKIQNKEDLLLIRTIANYTQDLAQHNVSLTGIKENCLFNTLNHFHAVQNYYVDIMHDLYEGVCHYDMLHILRHILHDAKYLSLNTLNERIQCFNYSSRDLNRPPKLRADVFVKTKISMSASEMLCFVRDFGLLIGDLVPRDDDVWEFYKILRQLFDLVHSEYVDDTLLIKLQYYIIRHNDLYQRLFKDTLKPKHHHLLHYARIMSHIGPIKYLSCMRYESKHRQAKMTANVSCSRVNITKTIAIKNQLQLCYRFFNKLGFSSRLNIGPEMSRDSINYITDYSKYIPPLFLGSFITKYISFCNIKYKTQTLILMNMVENSLPVFGKIELILVNQHREIGFLCHVVKVSHFDDHIHAYAVLDMAYHEKLFSFVSFNELYEKHDATIHRMADGKLFVNSKAAVY